MYLSPVLPAKLTIALGDCGVPAEGRFTRYCIHLVPCFHLINLCLANKVLPGNAGSTTYIYPHTWACESGTRQGGMTTLAAWNCRTPVRLSS